MKQDIPSFKVEFLASFSKWGELHLSIVDFFETHNISTSLYLKILICADELVSNIIKFAYLDKGSVDLVNLSAAKHNIEMNIELGCDKISLTFIDSGTPFDITKSKKLSTHTALDEMPIGGLGIHMVLKIMDEVSYERKNNRNIVVLTKYRGDLHAT